MSVLGTIERQIVGNELKTRPVAENKIGLEEKLIDDEFYFESQLAIIGGTIDHRDELQLKKLLFRCSRG